jgi:hypothetical protein
MKMRARREFVFSSCDLGLEIRLSPTILLPAAVVGTPSVTLVARSAPEDPLPDPEPSPGSYPGGPPTPTSGPSGPGSS